MLSPSHPLQLPMGLIIWSLWFVTIYTSLSVACALAPPAAELGPRTWINGVLLILTCAVALLLSLLFVRNWRAPVSGHQRFIARVAAGIYAAAALATLGVGLPVIALPPCL